MSMDATSDGYDLIRIKIQFQLFEHLCEGISSLSHCSNILNKNIEGFDSDSTVLNCSLDRSPYTINQQCRIFGLISQSP